MFGMKQMLLAEVRNIFQRRNTHFDYCLTQTLTTAYLRDIFFHKNSLTTIFINGH